MKQKKGKITFVNAAGMLDWSFDLYNSSLHDFSKDNNAFYAHPLPFDKLFTTYSFVLRILKIKITLQN